jgi:hypothetical protein
MDFIKKNYEKVLLGLVLIGLGVALGFLLIKINSERQKLEDLANSLVNRPVKALPPLDLGSAETSLKRLTLPATIDFSSTNRLFNPMPWQQTKDNPPQLIQASKVGPRLATVTNITPLYLRITLDAVNMQSDGSARYLFGVEKEAAPAGKRGKHQVGCSLGEKTDIFQLIGVNGPKDNPTNLVFVMLETGETNNVSKEQPFKRVDGYKAEIRYDPERKAWHDQRVGSPPLYFNNEEYKIVAIGANEVVLMSPNQKKWPIKLNSGA